MELQEKRPEKCAGVRMQYLMDGNYEGHRKQELVF